MTCVLRLLLPGSLWPLRPFDLHGPFPLILGRNFFTIAYSGLFG